MVRYFARIPSAAVRHYFDGHAYAYVNHRVRAGGIETLPVDDARMVRADDCKIANGEAWIYIGSMGDMVAQRTNLPFGVSFIEE